MKTIIEPFRIKMVEPIRMTTPEKTATEPAIVERVLEEHRRRGVLCTPHHEQIQPAIGQT